MKVLVIGGGGREHALVWKLKQSPSVTKIYCAPGNAGISEIAECIDIKVNNVDALLDFVKYNWIDLTVVGPEMPLASGIVDRFIKAERTIFGPVAAGAQLEGSKSFSKDFMLRYGIPTAEYKTFTSYAQAADYITLKGAPIVIKADGLAAGKGVIVAKNVDEATAALEMIMKDKAFGDAGKKVVVEQCLMGEEASFMFLTDGETVIPLATSQDHKQIFDGDKGPNTGGMGAYSPAPILTPELNEEIMEDIVGPIMKGLKREGIDYRGVLYVGIMMDNDKPHVLEFNVRFGDPEAQPILSRLDSDLFELMKATAEKRLHEVEVKWKDETAICIVLAAGGYPGDYEKGKKINGLDSLKDKEGVVVFHAGTGLKNGDVVTAGGRVLGVTALGKDIKAAQDNAYEAVKKIDFEGMYYRKDIGNKAIR